MMAPVLPYPSQKVYKGTTPVLLIATPETHGTGRAGNASPISQGGYPFTPCVARQIPPKACNLKAYLGRVKEGMHA